MSGTPAGVGVRAARGAHHVKGGQNVFITTTPIRTKIERRPRHRGDGAAAWL